MTFVIDRQGIVRHVFSSQFRPSRHVDEALKVLHSLRRPDQGTSQRDTG
jgi:peroxiredoxin Q/BCP